MCLYKTVTINCSLTETLKVCFHPLGFLKLQILDRQDYLGPKIGQMEQSKFAFISPIPSFVSIFLILLLRTF